MKKTLFILCALLCSLEMWADGTLTVDFESETTAYTDWVFTNFASNVSKSDVPAHGGNYIGTTNVKTTGSLQTKDKIATPKSITFYISKATDNTTTSSWKVQVSSDGTSWTDVATASATSMKIGEWIEVTQLLNSYNDVYVRIYYTGTSAVRCIDDVTLTYSEESDPSAATYSINIADIMNGGTVKVTPSTNITEGTTVTLNATPNTGYYFSEWRVTNATTSESIEVKDNKFQMPASNVNVGAIFAQKQNIRITWSINGNTSRHSDLLTNDEIEFPTDIANPVVGNTKTFVGWTESEAIEGEPTFVASGKATENKTYYAVFANRITKEGISKLTIHDNATVPYTDGLERTDDKGNVWKSYAAIYSQTVDNTPHYYLQISKNANGYYIGSPKFPSNVTAINAKVWNLGETSRVCYIRTDTNTKQPSSSQYGTAQITSDIEVGEISFNITGTFDQFYIYSSGAVGFEWIEVKYGSPEIVYSNYTTTIAPAPSSVNLNAKGYASFSSDYELSIDGATAYTAKVNEEAKTITWNAINDNVIPANEGVLLKGDVGEKATFAVSTTNKSNIADNDMRSNLVAKPKSELDGCIYVLSGENIIRLSETGTVGANKAYFNLSQYITNAESSTGAKTFTMIWNDGGIATGINNASTSTSKGIVYNLTGQRVNANAKGIVIIGGKKYINK